MIAEISHPIYKILSQTKLENKNKESNCTVQTKYHAKIVRQKKTTKNENRNKKLPKKAAKDKTQTKQ